MNRPARQLARPTVLPHSCHSVDFTKGEDYGQTITRPRPLQLGPELLRGLMADITYEDARVNHCATTCTRSHLMAEDIKNGYSFNGNDDRQGSSDAWHHEAFPGRTFVDGAASSLSGQESL